jgi:hypothetical protein
MKKRKIPLKPASPIRVHRFEVADSEDLFATFTLVFHGLAIPSCGAFYTRKGQFDFQLPYQTHFSMSDKDHAEISEKLAGALLENKNKKPADSDLEFPF